MTVQTKSQFYYGHTITESNFTVDFDDGVLGVKTANLRIGGYSLTDYATEIARAMNEVGEQTYSTSINRSTRTITITASASFDLLWSTGPTAGVSTASLAGFDATDLTGLTSYESQNASGSVYRPQFLLQNYIDFDDFQEASSASVSVSANSQVIQVASFGTAKFMEYNDTYITNNSQGKGGAIEENLTGVSDARTFLEYLITKAPVEFMKDRDNPATFNECILESSQQSRQGVGFRLYELYGRGLAGYFETRTLRFRELS